MQVHALIILADNAEVVFIITDFGGDVKVRDDFKILLNLHYHKPVRIPLLSELKFAKHSKEFRNKSFLSMAKFVLIGTGS